VKFAHGEKNLLEFSKLNDLEIARPTGGWGERLTVSRFARRAARERRDDGVTA
jgi:hypothetical protein